MLDRSIDIYYPPEATDKPPVGSVKVAEHVGGCVVQYSVAGNTYSKRVPRLSGILYEQRVNRAVGRAVTRANFLADLLLDHTPRVDAFI